jgi:hypothetical protein
MRLQCGDDVAETPFTIRLPKQALDLIEILQKRGLHGENRAAIARQLVLDQLKTLKIKPGADP